MWRKNSNGKIHKIVRIARGFVVDNILVSIHWTCSSALGPNVVSARVDAFLEHSHIRNEQNKTPYRFAISRFFALLRKQNTCMRCSRVPKSQCEWCVGLYWEIISCQNKRINAPVRLCTQITWMSFEISGENYATRDDRNCQQLNCDIEIRPNSIGSSRLDTFDVSSESRRACQAVLFQHGGQRTSYSARLYKFSHFYALTYTHPICSIKWNKVYKRRIL